MKSPEDIFYDGLAGGEEKKAEPPAPVPKPAPEPQLPKQLSSKSLFSHPEAHPVALDLALIKHFQLEWLSWLPDTLFSEIEKTFSTSIAEVNRLKILATQTLHVTDAYWDNWEIFEKTIMALNSVVPLAHTVQPPDLSLLFAGVDIADQIRSEDYSEEVGRYCAGIFLHENVHYAPEPLEFCQTYITQPYYECKDCGKKASALPPFDGLCSSCAGHFTHEKPFSFKPDPEAVERGAGQSVTIHNTYDPESVKTRFEELNRLPGDQLKKSLRETSDDVQSAKLIAAVDFKNFRAQQLRDQLNSLRGWLEAT